MGQKSESDPERAARPVRDTLSQLRLCGIKEVADLGGDLNGDCGRSVGEAGWGECVPLWAAGLGGRRSSRSVAIARFESQLLRLRPPPPKSLARLSSSTLSSGSSSGCEISGPRRLDTSTSTLEDDGPPAVALLRKGISLPAVAVVGAKTITHRRSHAGSGSRKAETGRYKRILADTISTFPQAHVRAGPRARTGVPYQRRR